MPATLLALTWPDESAASEVTRAGVMLADAGWTRRLSAPDLEVWGRDDRDPSVAEFRPGLVVMGDCWRRGSLQPVGRDLVFGAERVAACARRFVDGAWGGYLALLKGEDGGWWGLRDPSGAMDALTWRRGRLGLLATDLAPVPPCLRPADLALDWDVVTDLLGRPGGLTVRSPLHGLETVSPGALHALGGGAAPVVVWRPASFARHEARPDAEDQLRDAVELAVGAALAGPGPTLVEVSGGFDSAVVAATAERLGAGRRIGALHLYDERPEADERHWADIVCRRAALDLLAAPLEPAVLAVGDFDELATGARPALNAIDVCRDRRTIEAAEKAGAERLITGKGGDAMFFQPPSAAILSDLVAARCWRGWLDPLAPRLARRLRRSVWSVGLEARRILRAVTEDEPPPALLGPRARRAAAGPPHPWLEGVDALPPGRRLQIAGLVVNQIARGATRYGRRLDVRHPLLSQPVLEAALAIPVWRLARDGRERGLARDLFADRVPAEILTRRSKGDLSVYYARTVAENLGFLRPYLLDGCLCDAGVLDRVGLEAALEPDALIRDGDPVLILSAAAVEAFVRHWQARAPDYPRDARSRAWR